MKLSKSPEHYETFEEWLNKMVADVRHVARVMPDNETRDFLEGVLRQLRFHQRYLYAAGKSSVWKKIALDKRVLTRYATSLAYTRWHPNETRKIMRLYGEGLTAREISSHLKAGDPVRVANIIKAKRLANSVFGERRRKAIASRRRKNAEKARLLRDEGLTMREISAVLGVSRSSLYKLLEET